jgi:hypothetical protein
MVTVGRDGSLPHAPLTIGLPPDSWTEGVPEKARIVFSASFTPSAIAAFFVGSTETVGHSTKSRSNPSNRDRFSRAKVVRASLVSADVFMA